MLLLLLLLPFFNLLERTCNYFLLDYFQFSLFFFLISNKKHICFSFISYWIFLFFFFVKFTIANILIKKKNVMCKCNQFIIYWLLKQNRKYDEILLTFNNDLLHFYITLIQCQCQTHMKNNRSCCLFYVVHISRRKSTRHKLTLKYTLAFPSIFLNFCTISVYCYYSFCNLNLLWFYNEFQWDCVCLTIS